MGTFSVTGYGFRFLSQQHRKDFIKSNEEKKYSAPLAVVNAKTARNKLRCQRLQTKKKKLTTAAFGGLHAQGGFGASHKLVSEGHAFPAAVTGGLLGVTDIFCIPGPPPAESSSQKNSQKKDSKQGPFHSETFVLL